MIHDKGMTNRAPTLTRYQRLQISARSGLALATIRRIERGMIVKAVSLERYQRALHDEGLTPSDGGVSAAAE